MNQEEKIKLFPKNEDNYRKITGKNRKAREVD